MPQPQLADAPAIGAGLDSPPAVSAATALVQGLATTAEQRSAAVDVINALPVETQQGLAATLVSGLQTTEQRKSAAADVLSTLPPEQRAEVAQGVLGTPDTRTRQILWYMVIATMTLAIFAFGAMAFVLIYQKKAAEAPLALATTALGGIVGLVATSPGSRGSS